MLRLVGLWSCALLLACGSSKGGSPHQGGGAPAGDAGAGQGGASAGASMDGGAAGSNGGVAADGCALTFDGLDEPIFEPATHRFRAYAGPYWMTFEGAAFEGPTPSFHEEQARQGYCRLLTYEPSFCDPTCSDGKICFDGQCLGYPAAVSAGTLELRGAGSSPIELQPNELGHYYWSTEELGYDDVDGLSLRATGAVTPPFELEACLSDPPLPTQDWSMMLEARAPAADAVLKWSNPVPSARIYLRMTTGIGTHGGISPVEIECEAPDRGTLTIPGSYLDALYAEGWSCGECGGNKLLRYHAVQSGSGPSSVELRTESASDFWYRP